MSRTFLVTGGSKGIGLALSQRLARQGHQVVGIARKAIAEFPGEMVAIDLADGAETDVALRDLAARFAFDGVVNNVGLVRPQPLGEVEIDVLDDVLRVNLHPALKAVQAILPGMKARGWGRVVAPFADLSTERLQIEGMTEFAERVLPCFSVEAHAIDKSAIHIKYHRINHFALPEQQSN